MEEKIEKHKRNWIITIVIIIFLILILILSLFLISKPAIFSSGAYSINTTENTAVRSPTLSLDNSYVFASPLKAKVGGEQIRITVFILDDRGIGISGKTVKIGGGGQLQVTPIQPVTDGQGRATFDIASTASKGVFLIQANVDGNTLIQRATVTFE